MDRLPRAVGRMVVCVEDSAEMDTVSSSREATMLPATGSPRMVRVSLTFSSLVSPMPVSPKPANDCTA
jgi:hypothetical protein